MPTGRARVGARRDPVARRSPRSSRPSRRPGSPSSCPSTALAAAPPSATALARSCASLRRSFGHEPLDQVVGLQQGDQHRLLVGGLALGERARRAAARAARAPARRRPAGSASYGNRPSSLRRCSLRTPRSTSGSATRSRSGLSVLRQAADPALRVAALVVAGDRGVRGGQQRVVGRRAVRRPPACRRSSSSAPRGGEVEQQRAGEAGVAAPARCIGALLVVEEEQQELLGEDQLHRRGVPAAQARARAPAARPWGRASASGGPQPVAGRSSSRCSRRIRAAIALISSWPKRMPMHWREPPPNGT